ncbi:MAG: ABC transporter substrate-binding protein [Candidatus Magnetomorum sp.]|nr:ABC transporter substrate-binding protein [Candidatus Magnetomorum sp.]
MLLIFCFFITAGLDAKMLRITDSMGRNVTLQKTPAHVICSGAGALRLLTYLQAQDKIVAVDTIETQKTAFDARPYALSNPQFKQYPIFGEYRGNDNPEKIVFLEPQPEIIFKTFADMGYHPEELQNKTGIPVITLNYGNLSNYRSELYQSIHVMGTILDKQQRAKDIIVFFDGLINDLKIRTQGIDNRHSCYVGGVSYKGLQNFQSTEPLYPPFLFTQSNNVACDDISKHLSHSSIAKEKLIDWNPKFIFIDLASLAADPDRNVLYELKNDPAYLNMTAVQTGKVYGVLPYNGYAQNLGSIMANAYFVGKLLYPDRFNDVDVFQKADEIYSFLLGKTVFKQMNAMLHNMVFQKIIEG